MNRVNWVSWMMQSTSDAVTEAMAVMSETQWSWPDAVTGVEYYLTRQEWDRISQDVAVTIRQFACTEDLLTFLSGKDPSRRSDNWAWLFPFVPYPIALCHGFGRLEKPPARLCDWLVVRTALLYAAAASQADLEIDRSALRNLGYTSGLTLFKDMPFSQPGQPRLCDLLAEIEQFGQTAPGTKASFKVDLVKGGAFRIKQYYLETDKVPDMRGASILLKQTELERIPELIAASMIPECVIWSGGGNIFVLAPEHKGQEIAALIEQAYEDTTLTAQCAASFLSGINPVTLFTEYKETSLHLEHAVMNRQMTAFTCIDTPENHHDVSEPNWLQIDDNGSLCEHCLMRTPRLVRRIHENATERLCMSCSYKVLAGGKAGRSDYRRQFDDYARSKGMAVRQASVDSFADLADDDQCIGVLYGDGNNMGQVVMNLPDLTSMRYFSLYTEAVIQNSVFGALKDLNIGGKPFPFEIIAMGGDDIFMVVPGKWAVCLASRIGQIFDGHFAVPSGCVRSENLLKPMTLSVGVCIGASHTPIQHLHDLCEQLLKSAKKRARAETGGTMDVLVLAGDASQTALIDQLRYNLIEQQTLLTLRPYTWRELDILAAAMASVREHQAEQTIYDFREASQTLRGLEAELFFGYKLTKFSADSGKKNAVNAIQQSMKQLLEGRGLKVKGQGLFTWTEQPNQGTDENHQSVAYAAWYDLAELAGFLEGGR